MIDEKSRMQDWALQRFAGKSAVVTGGASGIGLAVVKRLLAEGAKVWVFDPFAAPGAMDEAEGAQILNVDITDAEKVEDAITEIHAQEGGLHVVVNAAGNAIAGTTQDTTRADWDSLIKLNLTGTFNVTAAAMRAMAGQGGSIINIGSDAGLVGQAGQAGYAASKGGVVHFTRSAALDGAPSGVRVNCVCPCFIETPMVTRWISEQPDPEAAEAAAVAEQPIGRMGQPHEIASAVAFLASDEANFVSGIALAVDGGSSIDIH